LVDFFGCSGCPFFPARPFPEPLVVLYSPAFHSYEGASPAIVFFRFFEPRLPCVLFSLRPLKHFHVLFFRFFRFFSPTLLVGGNALMMYGPTLAPACCFFRLRATPHPAPKCFPPSQLAHSSHLFDWLRWPMLFTFLCYFVFTITILFRSRCLLPLGSPFSPLRVFPCLVRLVRRFLESATVYQPHM